jgi:hypothetical protein
MLTKEVIIFIYESRASIEKISALAEVEERKVLLIRIGKLFANTTRDLVPGFYRQRRDTSGRVKLEKSEIHYILNSDEDHQEVADLLNIPLRTVRSVRFGTTRKSEVRTKNFKKRTYKSNPHRKLIPEQIKEILEKLKTMKINDVATLYGVSKQTISAINCGTRWSKIPR